MNERGQKEAKVGKKMKTLQMDSIQVPDILFKKKNLSLLKDVANLFEERSFLEFREGCFTISVL